LIFILIYFELRDTENQQYDNVTTPYCPSYALLSVKSSLTGGQKQTSSSKSGLGRLRGGRLQEVPNIVIPLGNLSYCGKLGRRGEVVAYERWSTGGSTVLQIDHFTVVRLVTWPSNCSEAGGDLALIQTSLLLSCKCT